MSHATDSNNEYLKYQYNVFAKNVDSSMEKKNRRVNVVRSCNCSHVCHI